MSRFIQTAYITAAVDDVERVIESAQRIVHNADRKAQARGLESSGAEFEVVRKVPVGYRGIFNKRLVARYELEIRGTMEQVQALRKYVSQFVF